MNDYKRLNYLFLITVVFQLLLSLSGIMSFVTSYSVSLIISQLQVILLPAAYLIYFKKPVRQTIRFNKVRVSNVLLCLLAYLFFRPMITFLNLASQLISKNSISKVVFEVSNEIPLLMGILFIAIVPAVFEETVYRGVYYNGYRERNPLMAVVLSGLLFGVMHGNFNQFLYATVLGMIFAIIVEATNSIVTTMIIHLIVNLSSTVLIYVLPYALRYVSNLYLDAVAANDTMTMELLQNLFGTGDMSYEALKGAFYTSASRSDIAAMLPRYALPAIIGTSIAVLIIRFVAKRSGRLDCIRRIFTKQVTQTTYPDSYQADGNPGVVSMPNTHNVFTWPLVTALVSMTCYMIFYELVSNGIIRIHT